MINLTLYTVNGTSLLVLCLTGSNYNTRLRRQSNSWKVLLSTTPILLNPHTNSQYITTPQPNPYPTVKDQKTFEKGLFEKTKKQSSDVILYDNKLVVYKQGVDVTMYVVGGAEENEIMLYLVVVALRDC